MFALKSPNYFSLNDIFTTITKVSKIEYINYT